MNLYLDEDILKLPKKKESQGGGAVQNLLYQEKKLFLAATNPNLENERTEFDITVKNMKEIADIINTIRSAKGHVSAEYLLKMEDQLSIFNRDNSSKLFSIFLAELLMFLHQASFPNMEKMLSVEEIKQIDRSRLYPPHRKLLDSVDTSYYVSLANDAIGVYDPDGKIGRIILLKAESDNSSLSHDAGDPLGKNYEKIKIISYEDIIKESEFIVRKDESQEKMLEAFNIMHQTPDLYSKFRELVKPQSPLDMSFKGIMSFFSLAVQLNESEFDKMKELYDNLHTQEQQLFFLESFPVLFNDPELMKPFLNTLKNPYFKNKERYDKNNGLLNKISSILGLIGKRNELVKDFLTEKGQATVDPWEFNEAILKRLKLLLDKASRVESQEEADKLLNESATFNEKLIAEGGFFRSNFEQIKNMKPEEIRDLFENFRAEIVQGGDLIIDPWDMENPKNYKYPEKFSVEDYRMIVNNLKEAYGDEYPKYLEVLTLNIAKDLQDEKVNFFLIKYKEELKGVAKIRKNNDGSSYYGTFYVDEAFQKSFKIGNYIQNTLLKGASNVSASVNPMNKNLERHKRSGWKIVGTKHETAIRKNGEEIMSEELLELELEN